MNKRLDDKAFCLKMTLSFLTIIFCVAVMASSAYALFFKNISAQNSTLSGAYYTVDVSNTTENYFVAPLAADDWHTFEITAGGNASVGYCMIEIDGSVYYTDYIEQGKSITFSIQAARDSVIKFTPVWGELPTPPALLLDGGELPANSVFLQNGGKLLHSVTPHAVYKIEPAAKLSSIAAYYGVSEAEIIIYNNLVATASELDGEPSVSLPVGAELKIPGEVAAAKEEYKVPYSTYIVEPTANVYDIAAYYNVPAEDIIAFNEAQNFMYGAELKIPNAAEREVPYAVPFAVYTVEPTAKLENISAHYKIAESDILYYNNITEIKTGEALKIPGVPASTAAYAVPYTVYRIEPTARLYAISEYYAVAVEDILAYNGLSSGDYIIAGTDLKIPSPRDVEVPYSVPYTTYKVEPTAVIDNIALHYGVTADMIRRFNGIENIAVGAELKIPYPTTSQSYAVPYVTYLVQPAARLMAISLFYGVSAEDILAYNNIQHIYAGMTLKIPSPNQTEIPYSVPYTTYRVEPTAKIADIAAYYGVTVLDICNFSGKDSFATGDTMLIPYPTVSVSYAVSYAEYTVAEGATVDNIAAYYGVTVADIVAFNSGVEIKTGASIKIPGVSPDTAPYVVPVTETPKTEETSSGSGTATSEQQTAENPAAAA